MGLCYIEAMKNEPSPQPDTILRPDEIRRLQEVEDNPFTADDEAMFAIFDREGWDTEQRIAYIRALFATSSPHAAE